MARIETKYTRTNGVHIAYQVVGQGAFDLVYVPGWVSHIELNWEVPAYARFLERLASFARLVMFDKRGTGLSDRVPDDRLPTLEERMDDLRAVMDAVGSERAALVGASEGGNLCALFAATYPERTKALVMLGAFAKRIRSSDYPWARTPEEREKEFELVEREWGKRMDLAHYAPSMVSNEPFIRRAAAYCRGAASPGAALALLKMNSAIDIRNVLPTIHIPTLLVHRAGDMDADVEGARWMSQQIDGARLVVLPGNDHFPWVGDQDEILGEIEEFLTGERPLPDATRFLTTILMTDIVESTRMTQEFGDHAWRELLDQHDRICEDAVRAYRGRIVSHTGDGIVATFDGPGRSIHCAKAISSALKSIGIQIRAGIHTGEAERRGDDLTGVAVILAARVSASAISDEVLVTRTVRDLVSGSGIELYDRGSHDFKGFAEQWQVYSVT
ncbi:adenylate/guanylate cyclase domain-containing protein [Candidatus Bipolaricaulota bacterium]